MCLCACKGYRRDRIALYKAVWCVAILSKGCAIICLSIAVSCYGKCLRWYYEASCSAAANIVSGLCYTCLHIPCTCCTWNCLCISSIYCITVCVASCSECSCWTWVLISIAICPAFDSYCDCIRSCLSYCKCSVSVSYLIVRCYIHIALLNNCCWCYVSAFACVCLCTCYGHWY